MSLGPDLEQMQHGWGGGSLMSCAGGTVGHELGQQGQPPSEQGLQRGRPGRTREVFVPGCNDHILLGSLLPVLTGKEQGDDALQKYFVN